MLSADETGAGAARPLAARQPRPGDLRQGLRALADGADHRAHRQRRPAARALGGEGRRAGLPRQGPPRPRAAAARDAVLDRAQALPGAARAPGQLRRAHRAAQPQPAARPPAPGGVRAARARAPSRWCSSTSTTSSSSTTASATTPATSCCKGMAERLRARAARGRHGGAPGRRRVRADPERPVERGGDLPRHAAHHRQASAEPMHDRRARSCTSPAAPASACTRRTAPTSTRC